VPIRTLPDVELIVTTYLRAHPDLPGGVSTELPGEPTYPWLTVARVGGVPSIANYLDVARLEISSWASTKGAALALGRGAEAAVLAIPAAQAGAVVTGVIQVGEGLHWNPDEETDVPRYQFVVEFYVHPA
jgi:hypothetical protein